MVLPDHVEVFPPTSAARRAGKGQGCSLAEVTLRQGIEPLLRRHVPEVVAVVDVTDHSAATAPFFAPGKR